ncbi:MAG: Fic family protein [Myxococcaceae bacterium]|nr:Fic family protein [Myxococcaceae bacterium]
MARFVQLHWPADPTAPGPRSARAAFHYRAFIPNDIARSTLNLPVAVAERVARAERAILELNHNPPALGPLEVLARRLLRVESVASSRIEGLELSQRRLARAEALQDESRDETARSVLANVAAMEKAIAIADRSAPLRTKDICAIHAVLMTFPPDGGVLRTQQSWIGGNTFNPHGAAFVPPPAGEVRRLIDDLCRYLEREDIPPVVQAAVAHAQFETIHPFADGNGRVGRALIHVVLRRRALASRHVPPISLVLAGRSKQYIDGLTAFREGAIAQWCETFADATTNAAAKSVALAVRFEKLSERWLERAGRPRSHSSAAALIALLPAYPILSLATAQRALQRSKQAANEALAALERVGVLKQVGVAKRNRAWEAPEVFDVLNAFERELATPTEAEMKRRAPYSGRGQSRAVSIQRK